MTKLEKLASAKHYWQTIHETGKEPNGKPARENVVKAAPEVLRRVNLKIKEVMEAGQ